MSTISFKINGKEYEVDGKYGPDVSLNEFIRTAAGLRGTKAMCQEGGCGACVVAVRAPLHTAQTEAEIRTFAVNSCLVSVLSCEGWEITTVEGVGRRGDTHPIQERLARFNGTQCGYCTPGWVMNMYSLYESKNRKLSSKEVENSFASNICRCTGYRPIADAFKTFATDIDDKLKAKLTDLEDLNLLNKCQSNCTRKCQENGVKCSKRVHSETEDDFLIINSESDKKMIVVDCGSHKWFKAFSLKDVFSVMGRNEPYKLIAGNTGQGVYHVTDYPKNVIDIFNVPELKGHQIDVNLVLGGGMPLTDMMELFQKLPSQHEEFSYLKHFYDHMDLVAHIPVRNIGTIAGNLFLKHVNNDFQSDLFLLFETVGGTVTIAEDVGKMKTVSLPEFLKTDMSKKLIYNVMLPPFSVHYKVKTYKIMPRSQNAHAVVNAGFTFKLKPNSDEVEQATIVYGSISPHFIHASKTEALLVGKPLFTDETLQAALKSLSDEINPEEAPPEPSANYRKMLALALFYKAILYLCPKDKLNPRYHSGGDVIKRSTSQGTQMFDTEKSLWPLTKPMPKLEALAQCTGEATFANDLPRREDEVYGAFVLANAVPGSVISGFDASEALQIPGVKAFYTAKDIPGKNSFTPVASLLVTEEEEILVNKIVKFNGQPAAIIVADREKTANKAAKLVKINYSLKPITKPLISMIDVLKSKEKQARVSLEKTVEAKDTGKDVNSIVYGELTVESQYHYTMEPQTCVVVPTEDGMDVYSATQSLDFTNIAIAECLNIPLSNVNVIVRRVGGAYGAKITRSGLTACAAAVVSHLQGKTCRFILPLMTNMQSVGKRVPTYCKFEAGVNKEGEIQYLRNQYYQDNGCSKNDNLAALVIPHLKNCYDMNRWHIEAYSVATDTASNTWCRAPGSTEGVAMIEYIMERIAFNLGKDPMQVRMLNMTKQDNPIPDLIDQLKKDANYDDRMQEIKKYNEENRWRKQGMKIIPMTYDLNYFGPFNAFISVFHADGSVMLTHGGVEMGQGINTKAAQVCAHFLGVALEKVSVKPSTNLTSPNSMTTGGSIGSELIAFCTMKACEDLLKRLAPVKAKMNNPTWEALVKKAYFEGVELQATHLYTANDGVKPYEIYGIALLEAEVDILTGNHDVRRVDLLEDTGQSMNPEIDVGQIEGAFVMGLGFWTSEKLVFDPNTGRLLTDRTWTYKPPGIKDIPADFRVYFRRNSKNPNGVLQSKATGEPAFCLAVAITHALREAVNAARVDAGMPEKWVDIKNPCSVEHIFMAVEHKIEHFKLK